MPGGPITSHYIQQGKLHNRRTICLQFKEINSTTLDTVQNVVPPPPPPYKLCPGMLTTGSPPVLLVTSQWLITVWFSQVMAFPEIFPNKTSPPPPPLNGQERLHKRPCRWNASISNTHTARFGVCVCVGGGGGGGILVLFGKIFGKAITCENQIVTAAIATNYARHQERRWAARALTEVTMT